MVIEPLPIIPVGSGGRQAEAVRSPRHPPKRCRKPGGSMCHSELGVKNTMAVSASAFCFKQGIVGKRDTVDKAEV